MGGPLGQKPFGDLQELPILQPVDAGNDPVVIQTF
jgi:hypothetical protein